MILRANNLLSPISQWHDIPRAIPVVRCYDAAVEMKRRGRPKKKKKRGYVLKWRGRASMSNKLWASKDKKLAARWNTCLRKMPAQDYEKLFPDSFDWVKKFSHPLNPIQLSSARKQPWGFRCGRYEKVKMWQVCRRMGFKGDPHDFSMWACLFADPAFTKVTVEELKELEPTMKEELTKFRKKHKWWPHPAVLLRVARAVYGHGHKLFIIINIKAINLVFGGPSAFNKSD